MTTLLKRLLFQSFLITLAISMIISFGIYAETEGLEARQGVFMLVIVTFILCLVNGFLTLPSYLNLNPRVREDKTLSGLSFIGLPLALLCYLVFLDVSSESNADDFHQYLCFTPLPYLLC